MTWPSVQTVGLALHCLAPVTADTAYIAARHGQPSVVSLACASSLDRLLCLLLEPQPRLLRRPRLPLVACWH
jgi:hypothetical protein